MSERNFGALETAELNWASNDPHLSGNFMPIGPETDAADLPVAYGRIPPELSGAYMRNGPNPQFKPISYTYPLDGDGMIHAVYFDNGRARYRNRYVRTRGLMVERRAGRAVYGGVMRPVPVDPALVGPDGDPGPIKSGAFINILRHGDHLLAFGETQPCYELSIGLDTIGEWTANSGKPIELGAHNRRHPTTGALFALDYSVVDPVVLFHQIDASGNLVKTFPVTLAAPTMIHDFVLTEHYIVVLACPAVIDVKAAAAGKPVLQWRPEMGTRIGVVALDGSSTTWLDAEPFFVFHFANGFERQGQILIDYVQHESLRLGYGPAQTRGPMLHRLKIDLAKRTVDDERLAEFITEFPRVDDRLDALPTRFVYAPTRTDTLKIVKPPSATFNTIVRVDNETGDAVRHDLGNKIAGEPVFIPRGVSEREDDGYLAIFAFDPITQSSDLVLLDAAHIDDGPVAVIRLPQRVPQGLHGNWIPGARLSGGDGS